MKKEMRHLVKYVWGGLFLASVMLVGASASALTTTSSSRIPNVDGVVNAIAVTDTRVYVGGSFAQPRIGLFAFDPVTGQVDQAWTCPDFVSMQINAICVYDNRVYVAGVISATVEGGRTIGGLVAVEPANGSNAGHVITSWAPPLSSDDYAANGNGIRALAVDSGKLYAGGIFYANIAEPGTLRRVAAYDLVTGALDTAWSPPISGMVYALAIGDGHLYAGGYNLDGLGAHNLMAMELANGVNVGQLDPAWNPNPNAVVRAVLSYGGKVYAGGYFSTVNGGVSQRALAAFEPANGTNTGAVDAAWRPAIVNEPTSRVRALAILEGHVHAGGAFVVRRNPSDTNSTTNSYLASFTLADGVSPASLLNNPAARGTGVGDEVLSLATSTQELFVGTKGQIGGGETSLASRGPGPVLTLIPPDYSQVSCGPVVYTVNYEGADTITLTADDVDVVATVGTTVGSVRVDGTGNSTRRIILDQISGTNGTIWVSIGKFATGYPPTAYGALGYPANSWDGMSSGFYLRVDPSYPAPPAIPELDSDGDGVSDRLENSLGTDPNDPLDPSSLPLGSGSVVVALLVAGYGVARRRRG